MLKHESRWKLRARHGLAALLCLCVAQTAGCLDMTSTETAICVLIDVSGTYSDQKADVVKIVKRERQCAEAGAGAGTRRLRSE